MTKLGIYISIKESSYGLHDNVGIYIGVPKQLFKSKPKLEIVSDIIGVIKDFMLNNKDGKTTKTY